MKRPNQDLEVEIVCNRLTVSLPVTSLIKTQNFILETATIFSYCYEISFFNTAEF